MHATVLQSRHEKGGRELSWDSGVGKASGVLPAVDREILEIV